METLLTYVMCGAFLQAALIHTQTYIRMLLDVGARSYYGLRASI